MINLNNKIFHHVSVYIDNNKKNWLQLVDSQMGNLTAVCSKLILTGFFINLQAVLDGFSVRKTEEMHRK
jgi:hypothetical protein